MNPEEDTARRTGRFGSTSGLPGFLSGKTECGPARRTASGAACFCGKTAGGASCGACLEAPKEAPKTEASFSAPEQTKEPEKQPQGKQAVRPVVHKYGFAAGVAVLLAALAGVVLLVCAVGRKNCGCGAKHRRFTCMGSAFLDAVVWNDPAPFEQLSDAAPGGSLLPARCETPSAGSVGTQKPMNWAGCLSLLQMRNQLAKNCLVGCCFTTAGRRPTPTYDAAQNLFFWSRRFRIRLDILRKSKRSKQTGRPFA